MKEIKSVFHARRDPHVVKMLDRYSIRDPEGTQFWLEILDESINSLFSLWKIVRYRANPDTYMGIVLECDSSKYGIVDVNTSVIIIPFVFDGQAHAVKVPGGKKLIYTGIDLPLTAIADFSEAGKTDSRFLELDHRRKSGPLEYGGGERPAGAFLGKDLSTR